MDRCFINVITKIESLLDEYYFFATDLETGLTWVTKKAAKKFEMEEGIYPNLYERLMDFVHAYDRNEYEEGMKKRVLLENLQDELCIRFGKGKDFSLYSIMCEHVKISGKDVLIVILKNENVGPAFDAITSLYGKKRFREDIKEAMENHRKMAIILVGFDHIEDISIVYGQECGDHIFSSAALRFIYMMTDDTAVYKINDMGFVFVLRNEECENVIPYMDKVRGILVNEINFQGYHLPIKCSAGGILLDGSDEDADFIQGKLEFALEESKRKYKGDLVFFNDLMRVDGKSNLDYIRLIHKSVLSECDGFYVEYQPIVLAKTGEIIGAEALVRWKKEPYGYVPPYMFIEWMENNSSMFELGNFVLERAIKDSLEFVKSNPKFVLNVNISCKQLERYEFKDVLIDLLDKYNFSSKNICLELTERCKNIPTALLCEDLTFFREHGIRIAIDDYGIGSSSSSMVVNLPVDEIKIDMSFVRGILENEKKQAFVKNAISFANDSGIYSCVEGVEDEEVQDFLRQYNPTWFQGYYYSKPVSAEDMLKLLDK